MTKAQKTKIIAGNSVWIGLPQICVLVPYQHAAQSERPSTLSPSLCLELKREKQVQLVSAVNPVCLVSTICDDSPSFHSLIKKKIYLSLYLTLLCTSSAPLSAALPCPHCTRHTVQLRTAETDSIVREGGREGESRREGRKGQEIERKRERRIKCRWERG